MTTATRDTTVLPAGWLVVDALDIEARGVARKPDGKVVFIEGALPFELVSANVNRVKNSWEQGTLTAIHHESSQRVRPRCPHFGLHEGACGGCKMQHLHEGAQVAVKQRVLEDNLWHLSKVKPQTVLRPIEGPAWGYRWRARFSVRHVHKKGAVLVGFHERKSRYVADIRECHVVPPRVSGLLLPLRALLGSMDAIDTCPQIELACGVDAGDPEVAVTALVLRHLAPLSDGDLAKLRAFAMEHSGLTGGARHSLQWWLQSKGPETARLLDDQGPELAYLLPEFGMTMPFRPIDFTQVNPHINRALVLRALQLLDVRSDERVIDWFCGLGNFTLPLATRARSVLGVDGSDALVARARLNYTKNKAASRDGNAWGATEFVARDLFNITPQLLMQDGAADKWLVDPPREGAFALVQALVGLQQQSAASSDWKAPRRICYVSCNPATLARDAGVLVFQAGYNCTHAGMVNMFPHTAHVESIAVFERQP